MGETKMSPPLMWTSSASAPPYGPVECLDSINQVRNRVHGPRQEQNEWIAAVTEKSKFILTMIDLMIGFDIKMEWTIFFFTLRHLLKLYPIFYFSSNTFFSLTPVQVSLSLRSHGRPPYHYITKSLIDLHPMIKSIKKKSNFCMNI